ncbi:MAG: Cof-type HAD-IIB family hydrolase [Planctomycetota bacterium]|nr:Cof-type HAD-IIB family hydrolase [Planctomycetota bacterium]
MNIRLIALDLDGTTLDSQGALRPRVRAAVAKAHTAGIQVVVCTGRRFRTAQPWARALGVNLPVVCLNGTLVKDAETGQTKRCQALPADLYREGLGLMRRVGAPLVYLDGVEHDFLYEPLDRVHAYQAAYLRDHSEFAHQVSSLDAYPEGGNVVAMSCMADKPSLIALREQLESQLGREAGTHLIQNKNYEGSILELASAGAGKWAGLSWICEKEGISAAEVLAIGDDLNDEEMIRRAGMGVAVGNAIEAVLAAADAVVATNDEEGVAHAIERFAL